MAHKYVVADRDGLGDQTYALSLIEINISLIDRAAHVGVDVTNVATYERFRYFTGALEPDFSALLNSNMSGVFKTELANKFWSWLSQPEQDEIRAEIVLGRQPEAAEVIPMWTDTPPV